MHTSVHMSPLYVSLFRCTSPPTLAPCGSLREAQGGGPAGLACLCSAVDKFPRYFQMGTWGPRGALTEDGGPGGLAYLCCTCDKFPPFFHMATWGPRGAFTHVGPLMEAGGPGAWHSIYGIKYAAWYGSLYSIRCCVVACYSITWHSSMYSRAYYGSMYSMAKYSVIYSIA